MNNSIPKIDEDDQVIGETTIEEAKANGWLRRISRVYALDPTREYILLQKRSMNMKSYPGCWDQAVGGHVDAGESYDEAAVREMREEIGIEREPERVATSVRTENTYDGVFRLILEKDVPFNFDPFEVESLVWTPIQDFESDYKQNPTAYCTGFINLWEKYRATLVAL